MKPLGSSLVILSFLCILALVAGNFIDYDDLVVEVSQGFVQGNVANSTNGRQFYTFRGIPYAAPPLGDLRFKAPVEASNWTGTFDASKKDTMWCIQAAGILVMGEEDCLIINVFTPSLTGGENGEPLPVLVFIYGGGFILGSTNGYGPERFMDKDVVLVNFNYRLGALGFFSTDDEAASGNWGLLDQVLALKWVQKNIAAFGGDPDQVTINGESAGSSSVMYQVVSPASAGLYRAAIAESGSSLSLWGMQRNPRKSANQLGDLLNCPTNDSQQLVDCLRDVDVKHLTDAAIRMHTYNFLVLPFLPSVETSDAAAFLPDYPLNLFAQGKFNKVPVISGTNKEDGEISYKMIRFLYDDIDEEFFNCTLPIILYAYFKYDSNLIGVSYGIKENYYDKIDTNNATQVARASIDFNTDAVFTAINDQTIHFIADQGVPVYAYVFSYVGSGSRNNYTGEGEVSHSDELSYLWDTGVKLNDQDLAISDALIDMWINFTYYLNPTPSGSWQQKTADNNNYLIINDACEMQDGYREDYMEFWNIEVPEIMGLVAPSKSPSDSDIPIITDGIICKSSTTITTDLPIDDTTTTTITTDLPIDDTTTTIKTTTTAPGDSGNFVHVSHFLIIMSVAMFICVAL